MRRNSAACASHAAALAAASAAHSASHAVALDFDFIGSFPFAPIALAWLFVGFAFRQHPGAKLFLSFRQALRFGDCVNVASGACSLRAGRFHSVARPMDSDDVRFVIRPAQCERRAVVKINLGQ